MIVLALAALAAKTNAEGLTYEPFSYSHDSLLSDLADGGTGWSGSWKSSGTNLLRVERANAVNQGYGLGFDSVTVRFEVTDMERLFIRLLVQQL